MFYLLTLFCITDKPSEIILSAYQTDQSLLLCEAHNNCSFCFDLLSVSKTVGTESIQMSYAWVLKLFNCIGILSAKNNETGLRISKFHVLLNSLKISAFVFGEKKFLELLNPHISPSVNNMHFTLFSRTFIKLHFHTPTIHCVITMGLQLVGTSENIQLLNKMLRFRSEIIKRYQPISIVFDSYIKYCVKNLAIFLIIASICYTIDFLITMKHTLEA